MTTRVHPAANNIIPASHIRLLGESLPVGAPGAEPCAEPQVNVIRDGDVVRAIEVVCTCGQRVVLDCVYGSNPAPRAPSPPAPSV
jgi:hypothetical protein